MVFRGAINGTPGQFGGGIAESGLVEFTRHYTQQTGSPGHHVDPHERGVGAEMLRLAILRMQDVGVNVVAPVHDAVMVEGPIGKRDEALYPGF